MTDRSCRFALLLTGLLVVAPGLTASADGAATAISGDMIELQGQRYCLDGIDAPEQGQTCKLRSGKPYDCGHIATTALMDLLAGATVRCTPSGARGDACQVARCAADGFDLSANMVHTGWALADPKAAARFGAIEAKAKQAKRGIWRGDFTPPWRWRHDAERKAK